MADRKGEWMQTFSGRSFWALDPRPEDVCIEDIAHSLAHQCRFAGHCLRFYSVAEHSVLLYRTVPDELKKPALVHDSPEAYVVDVPRPLKRMLKAHQALEDGVAKCIAAKLKMDTLYPPALVEYDARILLDEQKQNMSAPPLPWNIKGEPLGVKLEFWTPQVAEIMFLSAFREAFG